MSDTSDDASLLLFRSRPAHLAGRPPLASSLQSFESCLLLIALQRFPHALTTCASAIESALTAGCAHGQGSGLQQLFAQAQKEFPGLSVVPQAHLDGFRKLRNRIVHEGFHTGDDSVAASALLHTGFPVLASVYEVAFSFDLREALVPPFGAQFATAIEVFRRPEADPVRTLGALGHLTRWSLRESMMSPWELEVLDPTESYDLELDATHRLRERAARNLEPACCLDCPICNGSETLVCKLDEELLELRRIEIEACFCAACGLRLSADGRPILNAICKEELDACRDSILSEYGID
ncbi:MAG: hypothetical protein AB7O67_21175 [Vicinamibacterales bacterium]